jgi:type VI protein secretion system component VasF
MMQNPQQPQQQPQQSQGKPKAGQAPQQTLQRMGIDLSNVDWHAVLDALLALAHMFERNKSLPAPLKQAASSAGCPDEEIAATHEALYHTSQASAILAQQCCEQCGY